MDKNNCECCNIPNNINVFRGIIEGGNLKGTEVYQDVYGNLFDAKNSELIGTNSFYLCIKPLNNDKAITVKLIRTDVDGVTKLYCQRCRGIELSKKRKRGGLFK